MSTSQSSTWVASHSARQVTGTAASGLPSLTQSFPFRAYDNVLKDAVAVKSQALAMVPGSPTQVLFQPPAYPGLSQPSATALAQFQNPVQDLCLAYRDSLHPDTRLGEVS